jgi:DNA-binding NarL/FixJ family response regulator
MQLAALRRVADGQARMDPAVQMHLVETIAAGVPDPAPQPERQLPDGLTPREVEVTGLRPVGYAYRHGLVPPGSVHR